MLFVAGSANAMFVQYRVIDMGSLSGLGATPLSVNEAYEYAPVWSPDGSRIARANVHLVPDSSVPTSETGTRHRTAERVARSLGVPVIAVSQRMNTISVYVGDEQHKIEPTARVINRADQALSTLERYRTRLDDDASSLSTLEIEDLVTIRDVVNVLQRLEGVERIAALLSE